MTAARCACRIRESDVSMARTCDASLSLRLDEAWARHTHRFGPRRSDKACLLISSREREKAA
jgi:hypothetical protein